MRLPKSFRISARQLGYLITLIVFVLFFWKGHFLWHLDSKTYDLRLRLKNSPLNNPQVVIADIDEKSLQTFGRWPWPRQIMGDLVTTLDQFNVRAIGFDMVFAEEVSDTTESVIETVSTALATHRPNTKEWGPSQERQAIDRYLDRVDGILEQLAKTDTSDDRLSHALLTKTPIILGLIFNYEKQDSPTTTQKQSLIASSQICGQNETLARAAPAFTGVTTNLETFSHSHLGFGSFNFFPDPDGVSRRTPLVMQLNGKMYPSLALAILSKTIGTNPVCVPGSFGFDSISIGKHRIPTDLNGGYLIDFYSAKSRFPHFSIVDILRGEVPAESLENKIVLVGTSAPALYDLRVTPVDEALPGVNLHATVIQNILEDSFMIRKALAPFWEVLILLFVGMVTSIFLPKLSALKGALFSSGLIFSYLLFDWFALFSRGYWLSLLFPLLTILIIYLVITLYNHLQTESQAQMERQKRAEIKEAFQFYVSSSLVDEIVKDPSKLKLGGERRNLTVLFSDIRGFSTISERLTPDALVHLLNEYLTPMTDIVLSNNGLLDKYMGDAIMAVWGAPLPLYDHALLACESAIEMLEQLGDLQKSWRDRSIPTLEIGIGINTGEMSVGNMGSQQRFDYTVMGDHVNLGSRLEGVNKLFGTRIIVSEDTKIQTDNNLIYRELDLLQVKGKTQAVSIFELVGRKGEVSDFQLEVNQRFQEALAVYREQDWQKAFRLFEGLLAFHPEDGPTQMFLERVRFFREQPPPKDWNGVFRMETK